MQNKVASKSNSQNRLVLRGFISSLTRINVGGTQDELTESEAEKVKKDVAAFYDIAAATPRSSWNWGLYDDRIDRQIRERIPDYDQHGSDGFSEQLYCFALQQLQITQFAGTKILEVGCGPGDGLNFLSRLEPTASFTGIDLSAPAIKQANARYSRAGTLTFVQGDAEQLPFPDAEFDAVINIESAHNYPRPGRFFAEVERILKPGGHFSFVDCLTKQRLALLEESKPQARGLRWLKSEDISEMVKGSIRRRMDPQSFVRATVRKTVGFPKRVLVEPMIMLVYGARFVNHDFGIAGKLLGKSPITFETYHHGLAVKEARPDAAA